MSSSRVAQSARQYCASRLDRPVGNWALPTVDKVGVNIEGLEPGKRIVVKGLQRVRPNDVVKANSVAMASASPAKDAS